MNNLNDKSDGDLEKYFFNILMDNIPDRIYFKNIKGQYIKINKAAALRRGIKDPDEAINKTDFDFFTKEHAEQALRDEQEIIKYGKVIENIEEKQTWIGSEVDWGSTTKAPIHNDAGEIIGTFGITRDITARKLAQEALAQSEIKLRELNTIKDKFFSIIAHDLRGPFNGLFGLLDMVREDFDEIGVDAVKENLEIMNDILRNLFQLLEDLLEWGKIQRNAINFTPTNENICQTIQNVLDLYFINAKNKNINLILELPESIDIRFDKKYCLIYSKLNNNEADNERYGKSVLEFVIEGFHSEILTDMVENESVVKYHTEDALSFVTVCEAEQMEELKERCEQLIETCKKYFKTTVTCCIGNEYNVTELANEKQKLKKIFQYSVNFYGKVFYEKDVDLPLINEIQILDLDKIITYVENKDKARILHYLKQVFDELSFYKKMNLHSLYLMKQEMVQVVYADLMKHGIQSTKLFYDELSIRMADHAMDSTVDMVRWVNYLLEKTFEYEEEIAKSATIIEKIKHYIQEHYAEDIGRNEIAGVFFLTPEYLAKLYKKKTGKNLKDYINEYRIEKAKELLKAGEKNVSDIAESVGFDNFSYFSTLFKKLTGVSPKEYKNS